MSGGRAQRALSSAVLAVAAVGLVGWTWWMGRGFGFFSDEWNIAILANRGKLLEPFNGHLSVVPQLAYLGLSRTAGLDHYAPYRALGLACYVLLGALAAWHAWKRATPVLGALVGAAVLWSSAGRLTLLFPLLINFTIPLACCVAVWLLLDRTRPPDALGAVLLGVALASSAVGVVVALAIAVELAVRRVGWRRAVPYAVPVAAWMAWWLAFHSSTAQPGGIGALAAFAGRESLASFAALCAGWTPGGWALLVAFAAVLAASALRWKTFDARAASAITGFSAFVVLTAVGRQGIGSNGLPLPAIEPTTDRYLFVNTVFLLSALAVMVGPILRTQVTRDRYRWIGLAGLAAVALIVVNGRSLTSDVRTYRHDQLAYQRATRTFLLGAQLAGSRVNRRRVLPINYIPVTAGAYRDLLHETTTPPGVEGPLGSEQDRARADAWLIRDLGIGLVAAPETPAACPGVDHRGQLTALPGKQVLVAAGSSETDVAIARIADPAHATDLGMVPAGEQRTITLPASPNRAIPWQIVVRGAGAKVSVCR